VLGQVLGAGALDAGAHALALDSPPIVCYNDVTPELAGAADRRNFPMHIVIETDSDDQTIDVRPYCTDACARTDRDYAGWFGAQEPRAGDICTACGAPLADDDDSAPTVTIRRVYDTRRIVALATANFRTLLRNASDADRDRGAVWYECTRLTMYDALYDAAEWVNELRGAPESVDSQWQYRIIEQWHQSGVRIPHPRGTYLPPAFTAASELQEFAATIAYLSRGTSWSRQSRTLAISARYVIVSALARRLGMKTRPSDPNVQACTLFTDTADELVDISPSRVGPRLNRHTKVGSFYRALDGDVNAMTLDRHMLRACGARDTAAARAISRRYADVADQLRNVAVSEGFTPREAQAIVWESMIRLPQEKRPTRVMPPSVATPGFLLYE